MNRQELQQVLDREGIDRGAYDLRGFNVPEGYTLGRTWYGIWYTYFYEKGEPINKRLFYRESDACKHMLEELRGDSTTRKHV